MLELANLWKVLVDSEGIASSFSRPPQVDKIKKPKLELKNLFEY